MVPQRRRLRHIAGQQVIEGRDVGGTLDTCVSSQGHDPSAGPPDVAEQKLEDTCRPDHLHTGRVLRPADCIDYGTRALPAGVAAEDFCDFQEIAF